MKCIKGKKSRARLCQENSCFFRNVRRFFWNGSSQFAVGTCPRIGLNLFPGLVMETSTGIVPVFPENVRTSINYVEFAWFRNAPCCAPFKWLRRRPFYSAHNGFQQCLCQTVVDSLKMNEVRVAVSAYTNEGLWSSKTRVSAEIFQKCNTGRASLMCTLSSSILFSFAARM